MRNYSEYQLQTKVVKLLRNAGWVVFSIPNERNQGISDAVRMRASGLTKGAPDLICWDVYGYCWWFELKTKKGRRSIEQECMEELAHKLHIFYAVVRSTDEVEKAIQVDCGWR